MSYDKMMFYESAKKIKLYMMAAESTPEDKSNISQ